jgi:hypothetical protein
MRNIFVLAFLSSSISAYAHTEYAGKVKGTNLDCGLHIEQTYFLNGEETPANFRADVTVVLQDDHHGASHGLELAFTIAPGANPLVLTGLGSNKKDQVNVNQKAGSFGVDDLQSYAVKWIHINHFHSAQCLNLKQVEHENRLP